MRLPTTLILAGTLATACRPAERPPERSESPSAASPAAAAVESVPDAPRDGGTLYRRLFGEPGTLNAVLQTDVPEQLVLQYVSRDLFDFDRDLRLVPGVAQSLQVSPDGRTCTISLDPKAVWEDGVPVGADDVVFTIRAIADPATPAPLFKPLFEGLEDVAVSGPHEVRVRFRDAYAYRPMAFVLPLLPARRFRGRPLQRNPDNRAPLSDGPYRFASWKAQESIVLERNPKYWGERPHFDRIVFRVVPDNGVSYRALLEGSLDETWIDAEWKRRAADDPKFAACCRLVEFYDLDYSYIALDDRLPFFADARVRRALTMLLDREGIARTLFRGSARVVSGPWSPDSPASDPAVEPLGFDPEAAAKLLDEAGWRDRDGDGIRDRDGRAFDFELLMSAGNEIGRQIDEAFAEALRRVGIRVRLRPLEWATFVERVDGGAFQAASLASSASDPNPDPYSYWHSSQWPPAGLNSGFYKNPDADRLMSSARVERDDAARMAIYHRLHRIFRDDAPAIFLFNATKKYALHGRVHGVTTSPLGLFNSWPGPLAWWSGGAPPPGGPR